MGDPTLLAARRAQCHPRSARKRRSSTIDASTHRRIDASTRQCSAKFSTEQFPPHAYLCSPPAMVATAAAALNEFGINPERVYSDKYD